ncbi:gamma-glutamyltransferase family protein [Leifsonia sp. SIMBA_070]|uniref:gamma-glutamyltransferase family protein n=1 Tax=Leifsonia sp. SIMBA_070 TaxID=3085810 RepID=UPI003978E07A
MGFTPAPAFTTRPTLQGRFGMSASTHWLATASAQAVLERGGNAFDASVAAAFVLHVVEPHLNGPGGDLVALFATAGDPTPVVLSGQGPAPAAATPEHYRAEGLELVPGSGSLAAAVPGAVDAWLLLLKDHGTWELSDVLAFAIEYAEEGHPVLERVCATIRTVAPLFAEHWPTSAEHWMPGGRIPEPGELITNPAYARVLRGLIGAGDAAATREERIEAARREWATGTVAQAASAFVRTPHRHSDGGDHAGVIAENDFAAYRAGYEDAVTLEFRGHTLAKTGAWGQGPALLATLAILDGFDDAHLDPSTALGAHTILEAQKLAYADRDAYFGDAGVPLDTLLSPGYAAERRSLIGERASAEFRPGRIPGAEPFLPPLRTEYTPPSGVAAEGVGEPTVSRSGETRGDTCHIDVIDRWGNIVSATPSGGWLQSSPTIPELGFCLGTRLQMTWLEPGSASTLTPGKRPRTTLTPTLVLRDGVPVTALGSPGGDQQDQWQLLYLLRTLVGGYTPQQAIDAPALHTTSIAESFWPRTWVPAGAVVEARLGDEVIAELESRGHRVTRAGDWSLGRLSSVGRDPQTGVLSAAANPRGMQGYAAGR